MGAIDGVVHLDDGQHPPEGVREDGLPVAVTAPGRGQLEVLGDGERLGPAAHRRGHWPQVDGPASASGGG